MVREACLGDFDDLYRLFVEENRYTYSIAPDKAVLTDQVLSVEELEEIVYSERHLMGVYESEDRISGLVFAKHLMEPESRWSPKLDAVYIEILFVSESDRGQGIGTELLNFVKHWASKVGASSIELDVWTDSDAAINLYKKVGLKVRRNYMAMKL